MPQPIEIKLTLKKEGDGWVYVFNGVRSHLVYQSMSRALEAFTELVKVFGC